MTRPAGVAARTAAVLLFLLARPLAAITDVRLEIGDIRAAGGALTAADLVLSVDLMDGPLRLDSGPIHAGGRMLLATMRIDCPDFTLAPDRFACPAGRLTARLATGAMFAAAVDIDGAPGGPMQARIEPEPPGGGSAPAATADGSESAVPGAPGSVVLDFGGAIAVTLAALDLRMLAPLLEEQLPFPPPRSGWVSGRLEYDAGAGRPRLKGQLEVSDLAMDGQNSLDAVNATVSLDARRWQDVEHLRLDLNLRSGVAYLVPGLTIAGVDPGFIIDGDEGPATVYLDLGRYGDTLIIEQVTLEHPSGARVEASGRWDLAGAELKDLEAELVAPRLDRVYADLVQPVLIGTPLSDLEIVGGATIAVELGDTTLERLSLGFDEVFFDDIAEDRFGVAGLNGTLVFERGAEAAVSSLRWDGANLYRLDLGPASLALLAREGTLTSTAPVRVPIYDGALTLASFELSVDSGNRVEFAADGILEPVAVDELTQALGWPSMQGTIAGEVAGIRYAEEVLEFSTPLVIDVFGGSVTVADLELREPFGNLPRLTADITLEDLDLEAVTGAFSFGRISGRIGGQVKDLQLEDWAPVYFELDISTPADDDSRHRISQQAVNNLGVLGGGSGNILSSGLLQFFQEYSYDELGISCRLQNGFCAMGGVRDTPDGFYILTPGGLFPPWVAVTGTGRSIEWQSLVDGLKRIARGEFDIQ